MGEPATQALGRLAFEVPDRMVDAADIEVRVLRYDRMRALPEPLVGSEPGSLVTSEPGGIHARSMPRTSEGEPA